jgi:DnaJ-class molecular chaperone
MKCFTCKGTGQAFSYSKGLIVCATCGGSGKVNRKLQKVKR